MQDNPKELPSLGNYVRALRLPFISASVLGFTFGSFICRDNFNIINFLLGLISVVFTHTGANLINDYADSRSGADWQDMRSYNFFGGTKLIQQGVLSEKFYFKASIFCFLVSILAVIILIFRLGSILPLVLYPGILFLGWAYSERPFSLAYHRLGELVIFLLFGPALVMGGYFIQTGIFPDLKSFLLSVPFGILTTLILFVNEIPDYDCDYKVKKINWVSFLGPSRSYFIYIALCLLAIFSILININFGFLGWIAYLSFIFLFPALKTVLVLKNNPKEKEGYIFTSQMTIFVHTLVSIVLIINILI